jgi:predicted nucleic acid-binding protein
MTGTAFVDTNVLVYCRDRSEAEKQPRAEEWLAHLWNTGAGRVSMQVLNEFYVTVTQKLRPGLDPLNARDDVRSLLAWQPLHLDPLAIEEAWGIQDRYGASFWDSLIVAAALRTGSRYLLSEDFRDGQLLDGLRVVDPFRHRPQDLD